MGQDHSNSWESLQERSEGVYCIVCILRGRPLVKWTDSEWVLAWKGKLIVGRERKWARTGLCGLGLGFINGFLFMVGED